MPSLSAYKSDLDYSYAPGIFPSMECLLRRPAQVRRLLLHSSSAGREGTEKLRALAESLKIRAEEADRALARISGKENCYAAAVFSKFEDTLDARLPHIVLHHPGDSGNLGTILRTALGFGWHDIAVIRPAADAFDPKVVRASMGAIFSLRLREYEDFDSYRRDFPGHDAYPFMLDGSCEMDAAVPGIQRPCSLIFGNEGAGLPGEFQQVGRPVRIPSSDEVDSLNLSIAAAIGIYAFRKP